VTERELVRATRTPDGPATLRVIHPEPGRVEAEAWGPGAEWALERVPALLGLGDDPEWEPGDERVAALHKRARGMRLARTERVMESLIPVVLEQLVSGPESQRAYRNLVRYFDEPAPGPYEELRLMPSPKQLATVASAEWLPLGVLRKQGATLRRIGEKAHRLEEASRMDEAEASRRLQALPGIGPWTAGCVSLFSLGHADAVPVGDYNLPHAVAYTLAGEERADDERMLELLAPFAGQRGRVVRLIKAAGRRPPRRGPRREIRSIIGAPARRRR
jgi:3-methyladenine DNA glycosylase/8-oxoguanine DNA glycosylase